MRIHKQYLKTTLSICYMYTVSMTFLIHVLMILFLWHDNAAYYMLSSIVRLTNSCYVFSRYLGIGMAFNHLTNNGNILFISYTSLSVYDELCQKYSTMQGSLLNNPCWPASFSCAFTWPLLPSLVAFFQVWL